MRTQLNGAKCLIYVNLKNNTFSEKKIYTTLYSFARNYNMPLCILDTQRGVTLISQKEVLSFYSPPPLLYTRLGLHNCWLGPASSRYTIIAAIYSWQKWIFHFKAIY